MVKDRKKRVRAKRSRSGGVDYISNLPDCLLCEVLSKLPTKDIVKTSVLSTRWRNLWKDIPRLDLDGEDFPFYYVFVDFVNRFLDFNRDSYLDSFKLSYPGDGNWVPDISLIRRWIRAVIKLKVKHLDFVDDSGGSILFHIPSTIYTCQSLVSLKLCCVNVSILKSVSLTSLKDIDLNIVKFPDDLAIERFISGCPVLENLVIRRPSYYDIEVLRVCSQSLLSFTHVTSSARGFVEENLFVEIDAPKLEYLRIRDHRTANFIIKNHGSLVELHLNTAWNLCYGNEFNPKRNMVCNFLGGISRVKDMTISSSTLEVIYEYSRFKPLPLFCYLSSLRVKFYHCRWEILPIFLQNCPNLKSLVLLQGSIKKMKKKKEISILSRPQCLLPSLEYVEIKRPLKWRGDGDETSGLLS
ncbi:F-box/LRR-repeat protein 13 [Cardamine amara subsp. amara]|uniref:F-box/LRR-repeat protein 13 n=1 Tax=Cardamine amara subsp. amara TaxID=228776 RepID=A0ABD1AFY5_CARAN